MGETQGQLKSRTVISAIIGILSVIAGYFGYQISGADTQELIVNIETIVSGVMFVSAWFFRIKATKVIV